MSFLGINSGHTIMIALMDYHCIDLNKDKILASKLLRFVLANKNAILGDG